MVGGSVVGDPLAGSRPFCGCDGGGGGGLFEAAGLTAQRGGVGGGGVAGSGGHGSPGGDLVVCGEPVPGPPAGSGVGFVGWG